MDRQTDQNMDHRTSQIAETVIGHQETENAAPAHTPTPWYHRQAGETSRYGDSYDWIADSPNHGEHRKIIVSRDSCDPADYAFIVKAVNNHEALVKALEPFAAAAENDIGQDETDADIFQPMRSGYNRAPLITVGDMRRAKAALSDAR